MNNPIMAGGMGSTARCWQPFQHALWTKTLLQPATHDLMRTDQTADANFRLSPTWQFFMSWHYGYGIWIECPYLLWQESCYNLQRYTAAGAFGALGWVDYVNGYYGIFWRQDCK